MSRIPLSWSKLAIVAALMVIIVFLISLNRAKEKAGRLIEANLTEEIAHLKQENELLGHEIADLKNQNIRLKNYVLAYEENFIALKDAAKSCYQIESKLAADLPAGLTEEPLEIRRIYVEVLGEFNRWNHYQREHYREILESTVEPRVIEAQSLALDDEENRKYFVELEDALKLHKRLIRDVRLFHDEIQYQKKRHRAQEPYQLYDLKFNLAPFARESALVDALQQAMSALSSGIYQTEAEEVLDRIGEELTRPIRQLYERQQDTDEPPVPAKYNYNLYTVYGKKLMDYADTLAHQTSIPLGPLAFGELDFFNRRLYNSLYDLYQVGQDEAIDPSQLDLDELEQFLFSNP